MLSPRERACCGLHRPGKSRRRGRAFCGLHRSGKSRRQTDKLTSEEPGSHGAPSRLHRETLPDFNLTREPWSEFLLPPRSVPPQKRSSAQDAMLIKVFLSR
ncbi:hypothetical protein CesoFtcFv8_015487 [Champsocephalus esox]|uniref:Uncharacterized protein n=2 Tax=Champsocephalus TaxID=52236 RepID=A0AAN8DD88_CHAGU|nr:hypothetical protein CesoFtcFv8_015487 [Champsocephalus esox]KAK5919982.1 hypothetical protein CgunFtcFv8_023827 [Champsocephalus gunnari]